MPQNSPPRMILERKTDPSPDSSETYSVGCLQATSPSLLWLLRPLPERLIIMELSHQRRLYFVPQRPNGASVKWLFVVSNKHFLGVINLYAKVTVGTGVAAQTVLVWGCGGRALELEQAAVRLSPPP